MIILLIAIYFTLGYGALWFLKKVYDESFPDIMRMCEQEVDDDFDEIESKSSEGKALAKIWLCRLILIYLIWPVFLLYGMVCGLIGKARGQ